MRKLIARFALVIGLATAALLFTTGGGSDVAAAAYPYCGPATGPCTNGYVGYTGYAGYAGYPYNGYANYVGVYNYAYAAYRPVYVPTVTNIFTANGCTVGNYTCLRNKGVYAPYGWWGW
jgi:hypothetical protein